MKESKTYPPTPELDKMRRIQNASQAIGEFLHSLSERNMLLCERHKHSDGCYTDGMSLKEFQSVHSVVHGGGIWENYPNRRLNDEVTQEEWDAGRHEDPQCELEEDELVLIRKSIEQLLAEYFEIDLQKVEEERRTILEHIRNEK